ncbi:MAG: protein kinase [Polyangiaceae bacterium]
MHPDELTTGTVLLNKYRVVRHLGAGGMGMVVCAEHIELGKLVALKFLLPAVAEFPDMAERFMREARAATRIAGEHVAQVLDVGRLPDGLPYMVMEYLEGLDLSRYCDAYPNIPVEEAIEYTAQAGAALISAHRIGIVHRDIKPANLFRIIKSDGSALIKVLDFGISKFTEEDGKNQITKTTAVMGSVAYMSPEQMRSAKHVDHRTDIYALGVCLYELLSGTQPYVADSPVALAAKVGTDPPDPMHRHRKDVPHDLALVLEKAYEKRQDDRYQSVEAFLRALSPFASSSTRDRIAALAGTRNDESLTVIAPDPSSLPPEAAKVLAPTLLATPAERSTSSKMESQLRRGARLSPLLIVTVIATVAVLLWIALTPRAAQNAASGAESPPPTTSPSAPPSSKDTVPDSSPNDAQATANPSTSSSASGETSGVPETPPPVPSSTEEPAPSNSTVPSGPPRRTSPPKVCYDKIGLRIPCK